MKLSKQQQAVIDCNDPVMVVHAVAGSGKTTTAVEFARAHLEKKILSVQFGAANAAEAKQRYPKENTLASTMHALAINILSEAQRKRLATRYSPISIKNDLEKIGVRSDFRLSACVFHTLNAFFQSADEKLDYKHTNRAYVELGVTDEKREQGLVYAKTLWQAMQTSKSISQLANKENTIEIPHDAYLKMFALSNLRTMLSEFDTVILDEAQDANPVMIQVIERMREAGKQVILLGDEHQSIYSFRGAVNAMQIYDDMATHLPLTQSWRFGAQTAALANEILGLKGGRYFVEGLGEDRAFDPKEKTCFLSRGNAELIEFASGHLSEPINWIGGIDNYNLGLLQDMFYLYTNKSNFIKDAKFKKSFPTLEHARLAAEYDGETKRLLKIVEEHTNRIPELVLQITHQAKIAKADSAISITTAHKSKGLEFNQVALLNDFSNPLEKAELWCQQIGGEFPTEEINLLYMAVTRAKYALIPNEGLANWVENLRHNRTKRRRFLAQGESANGAKEKVGAAKGKLTNPLSSAPIRSFS